MQPDCHRRFTLTAQAGGFNVIDPIPALESLEYPSASLIARQESVRKDAPTLDMLTRTIIEAVRYCKTRKAEAKKVLQKYMRTQNQDELEELTPFCLRD